MPQVRRTAVVAAFAAAALALSAVPAAAAPAAPPTSSPAPGTVFAATDQLARQVASTLADRTVRDRVTSTVAKSPADVLSLGAGSRLAAQARSANRDVLAAKGLPADSGSLLQLRLANPAARTALRDGQVPLVAAAPTDDQLTAVTAYDPNGGSTLLDPKVAPQRPVLVVEVDVAKALPAGLTVMRHALDRRGVSDAAAAKAAPRDAGGYWATKVNSVRLNDDEEPWVEGDAEIYSIVSGWGLDGHPAVNIVQMPYLDDDGTTYYPNQLLVQFKDYKYDLADVVMMEDDGDTNYQALATAIADALLTLTDLGAYTPLVNAILSAIPSSWWTNDPDYTDSWYTLATTSSGTITGAAGNGTMDLSSYWVSGL
ncbi:MAG: DUF3103 family protein [Actinocatenispora sp.]